MTEGVGALGLTEGTLGAAIVGGAVTGAIGGATYSGVSSELSGNSLKQVAKDTLTGGLTGAVAGGAMGGVTYGAGKVVDGIKSLKGVSNKQYVAGDATFMKSTDRFVENISKRKNIDADGYFEVIAHGTPDEIQIVHNGKEIMVDARTAARLIENSEGYNGQPIRLLSYSTGAKENGFAQNLANKLNVEVKAPNDILWSTENGEYFVAARNEKTLPDFRVIGKFESFYPGGH